jgi:hypothetical protein
VLLNPMIKTLVPDNMKAIVKDADALNPVLVAAFLDYAQARGIFVDPARVRSPKDKPRVENQVPFVRESWFDGEPFADLDDARRRAEHWCRDVAGMRVHGTTRKAPRELFESTERAATLAPPSEIVAMGQPQTTVHAAVISPRQCDSSSGIRQQRSASTSACLQSSPACVSSRSIVTSWF